MPLDFMTQLDFVEQERAAMRRIFSRAAQDLPPDGRAALVDLTAASIRLSTPDSVAHHDLDPAAAHLGDGLRRDGCVGLGPLLTQNEAAETRAFLQSRPAWPGHTKFNARGATPCAWDEPPPRRSHVAHESADVLAAPHVLTLVTDPTVQAAAQAYLGAAPTFYAANAFWSHPHRGRNAYTQTAHRDVEMLRTFSLFVLLTDHLEEEDGGHIYLTGSHHPTRMREELTARGLAAGEEDLQRYFAIKDTLSEQREFDHLRPHLGQSFFGPAGTAFATDPYGLHLGLPPTSGPRLVLWLRWGLHQMWEGVAETVRMPQLRAALPNTPRQNYIHRLFLGLA